MNRLITLLKNLSKKQLIAFGLSLILLIALPLVVLQVQKQQSLRQHASEDSNALTYFKIDDIGAQTLGLGSEFETTVHLINNDPSKQITALDITIQDGGNGLTLLEATSIPESGFSEAINSKSSGTVHYVVVNLGDMNAVSNQKNDIPLLKLKYSAANNAANGTVGIINASVTILGNSQAVQIADSANRSSPYVITAVPNVQGGNPNPATLAFIDFIQGSIETELDPLLPQKIDLAKELTAVTSADMTNWKKALGIFGIFAAPVNDFQNDLSFIYLAEKERKVADLTQQMTVYDLVREESAGGRGLNEILRQYGELVTMSGNSVLLSNKGIAAVNQKYDGLIAARDKQCQQLRDKPTKERIAVCNFYPYSNRSNEIGYSSDPVIGDIYDMKKDQIRLITALGNPEPLLTSLANYDRVTGEGSEGASEGLDVYYQLAKRFDKNTDYGSAIELYDQIATAAPASEIGKLSQKRIGELHSFGHQSKRVFYHIGASLADPTIILPIDMCGPGGMCKLIGKALLKSAVVTKTAAKFGAEKTAQFLVKSYGISREAADAVVEVSSKLAKDETGEVNFEKLISPTNVKKVSADALKEAKILLSKTRNAVKIDQTDLAREVQGIAILKNDVNYKNRLLSDIEKAGGKTISAAQGVLSNRVLGYVDHYANIGFMSIENAKIFRETVNQMARDMTEQFGKGADGAIDITKISKIDELMHKTIASVSYLEHVASGQKFSDHSFRHLYEDISKAMSATSFTSKEKIYFTFASLLHDIGYSSSDIVQNPLNFLTTKSHPETSFKFAAAEIQNDFKNLLGEESARITESTLQADFEVAVGKEGTATILYAIRKHGDKSFKYTLKNLTSSNRVAAILALSDDLAANKVPDLYRYPEIAKIVTNFFKESRSRLDIARLSEGYGNKLLMYTKLAPESDNAKKILKELAEMDHVNTAKDTLGAFREGYREQMLAELEKYRPSIPNVRYQQFLQAIAATTENDFSFALAPVIIEKTSFSIGENGAHVAIEISEPLYQQLSQAVPPKVIGNTVVDPVNDQLTKILKDLIVRSSETNPTDDAIRLLTEDLLKNRGGPLGSGNDVEIKFVQSQSNADILSLIR